MPTIYNQFAIQSDESGSTSTTNDIVFFYNSASYNDLFTSGALATIKATTLEANHEGARGELEIVLSTTGSVTSSGVPILRLFHTGSNDEPRVGIGFASTEPIDKSLEIKTKKDSAEGTEVVLEGSRTSEGAQIGDEAGKINFVINSGSFEDKFSSGSLAHIKTVAKGVSNTGVQGRLVMAIGKDNISTPSDIWSLGYDDGTTGGILPNNLGVVNVFSGSIQLTDFTSQLESSFSITDSDSNITFAVQNRNNTQGKADLYLTGDITGSNISASNEIIALSASIDHLAVNDKLQGNGSGFQFFAFNEDTTKVKFANWFTGTDNQYGMGMLWYETWFAAIDTDGDANDINRRIGFYLEQPEAGATDSTSGETGRHPNNARFYVDVTGSYVASGSLTVTDANFKVSSSGAVTSQGYAVVSQSSAFTDNEFIIADGTGAVTSTDALAVDSSGNLGIGTNAPAVRLHMVGEGAQTSQFRMDQYNDTADAPDIRTKRARGTETSPSDIQTNDYLFRLNVEGQKGGSMQGYGSIQFDVDGTDADALNFKITTRDTAGSSAVRYQIDGSGDHEFTGDATVTGDLAINGISNVSASIADAAGSGGGGGAVTTYTNGVNNRIITSTGTDGINGESTLTYNGTLLTLDGTMRFTPGTANNGIMTRVDNQWESTTLENNGEYIQVGTAISRTQHALYNLGSSGWVQADADATTTSTGLLGIAVDGNSGNDFLIKGIYNTNTVAGTTPAIGDPVYVSTTAGRVTVDAPTATGDVVRCCGHIIDTFTSGRTTYYKIYFNPSPDFIEN